MPYIKQYRRTQLDKGYPPVIQGELNYKITKNIMEYLAGFEECYSAYNEVLGVLECIKLELYRRMVGPYEDRKIKENGDVYNVIK